jgi:hypothetical protein
MQPKSEALLRLLERELDACERRGLLQEIAELDERLEGLLADARFDEERLAEARLCSSTSLVDWGLRPMSPPARQAAKRAWASANALVITFVSSGTALGLDEVGALNAAVLGKSGVSLLRQGPVSMGPRQAPNHEDLDALLAPMFRRVEARERDLHPVAAAALFYQWIVSVHPYADGNGRTGRLCADWVLAAAGYPPMSFPTSTTGLITLFPDPQHHVPVAPSIRVVIAAIQHSLGFCSETPDAGVRPRV